MINPNTNKSLAEVLDAYFEQFSFILNCVKIGKITSFDKTKQTCNVQILHKPRNEYVLGVNQLLEYPELIDVPVVIMGGGSSYITHPISAGDTCLLLFNDFQKDGWQNSGNKTQAQIQRRHDISDAIAIVGLRATPNAIGGYSDYLDLHYSDNSSIIVGNTIEVNNQNINLNGDVAVSGNSTVGGNETVTGVVSAATISGTTISGGTISASNGATGSFVSKDNKQITVTNGIITSITE